MKIFFLEIIYNDLLRALSIVDERVDGGVRHGQPVESEVDMFSVAPPHNARVEEGEEEVQVVREP